ncbi:type II secretion system protein GspJ [Pelotalea chapellei]|uniref:type II secretion system protein GspJ n=1 Tax=Pelotalea chapellei TaxID=44671 RepID=UPI001FE79169|nr:type II secretion system protein GspJ [Pelotalea chapellei]
MCDTSFPNSRGRWLCQHGGYGPNAGFTLLELLIALVLLAILTTALYSSYFAVMAARERAGEGMEARRELGSTLDRMRQQINAAQFSTGDKRLHFVVEDRDIFGAPSSTLELTTLAEPSQLTRPESGVINSRYHIVERDKRRILTSKDQDILFETDTAPEYPQMERITGFLVECYDGSKWVRSWDTALNLKLPQQVRITVQVEEDGRPVEFSTLAVPRVKIQ